MKRIKSTLFLFLAIFVLLVGCESSKVSNTEVTTTNTKASGSLNLTENEVKEILNGLYRRQFKSQTRQNQLIEKITISHLVVGVDIAQQTHVARAVNFRGIILGEPLSFSNDEVGSLHNWIKKLQAAHHLSTAINRYGTNRALLV